VGDVILILLCYLVDFFHESNEQYLMLFVEVFAQRAFDEYRADEVLPGSHVQSDADIDAFVRATAETAYHPSCTCRMGSPEKDDMVVVDPMCRVVGVERLRVVDASIMPSIVSGNLNGPVIMLAEKAADLILGSIPSPSHSASSSKWCVSMPRLVPKTFE